jgi:hypothetical protein
MKFPQIKQLTEVDEVMMALGVCCACGGHDIQDQSEVDDECPTIVHRYFVCPDCGTTVMHDAGATFYRQMVND